MEWSGPLFYVIKEGSIEEPEKLVIELKHILLMDIGSGAYTAFKVEDEIIDVFDKFPNAMKDKWAQGLIHSHNNMATFFSGTDNEELVDNSVGTNFYLSVIVNNKMDVSARIVYRAEREIKTKTVTERQFTLPSFFKVKQVKEEPKESESLSKVEVVVCIPLEEEWQGEFGESLKRVKEIKPTTVNVHTYRPQFQRFSGTSSNTNNTERTGTWYADKEYKWIVERQELGYVWKGTNIPITRPKPEHLKKANGKKLKGKEENAIKRLEKEIEDDFETIQTNLFDSRLDEKKIGSIGLLEAIQIDGGMPEDKKISFFARMFTLNNYKIKETHQVSMDDVFKAIDSSLNVDAYEKQVSIIIRDMHKNFTSVFNDELLKCEGLQDIKILKYYVFARVLEVYLLPYEPQQIFAKLLSEALLEFTMDLEEDIEDIVFTQIEKK